MVELRITREKKHFATNGKEALTFSQTTAALFRSIELPSKNHSVDREPFRERNTPALSRFVTRSIDVLYSSYYILWLVVDFLVRDSTDFVTPVSCHVPRNERANNIDTFRSALENHHPFVSNFPPFVNRARNKTDDRR